VDVKKMDEDDEKGNKLTGGYIMKVDKWALDDDMSAIFEAKYANYTITEPSDEVLTPAKVNYIQSYVTEAEYAMVSANHTSPSGQHYSDLIDVTSFADMFIIQELSKNVDAYRLSTYFYKDRGEKMVAGPVWDLDRTYGNQLFNMDTTMGWIYNDRSVPDLESIPQYWGTLLKDPKFTAKLKTRWTELRKGPLSENTVVGRIIQYRDLLQANGAAYRDYNRWGPWFFPFEFWVTENYNMHQVGVVIEWTKKRLAWMDGAIYAFP